MSKKLRILQVLTPALHPNKGGVQMTTCKLAAYFYSKGHTVFAFSFSDSGHEVPENLRFIKAEMPGSSLNQENLLHLGRVLLELKPDVVINHMPYDRSIGSVLGNNSNYLLLGCLRNTLFSVKGDLDSYLDKVVPNKLRKLFSNPIGKHVLLTFHRARHRRDLTHILKTYEQFVMFGPPNLGELEYFLPGFDRTKVALIPNSIPTVAEFVPQKEKRLLWLGRVSSVQKRSELIPLIWAKVSKHLSDWQLDIVGDGPDLDFLKQQIAEQRLPRVNFYGRQQPNKYFSRSAVFFMTSAFEGFPNTLIEAQSFAAVPVVFDSYPVASWIVNHERNGMLARPFDVQAMADQIVDVATNARYDQLAENCLRSAQQFHIDRVGAMWEELFSKKLSVAKSRKAVVPQQSSILS